MTNNSRHAVASLSMLAWMCACPVEQAAADYFSKWGDSGASTGSTSASSTAEETTSTSDVSPTTGVASAAATSAGESSDGLDPGTTSSEGSSGGELGEKGLPVHVQVHLSPSPTLDVGEVQISVWTSRPVTSIDIYDDNELLVLGAVPASPVHVFEVTSDDVPGDGMHKIRAVAHAADGVSGEDSEDLLVDVQPGGTDVWPPYVQDGVINGFTGAALLGNGVAVAGFLETKQGLEAVALRIDGAKGQPESEPLLLGPIAFSGEGRGPAIAAAEDGAVYVASSRPDTGTTRWIVNKLRLGEPLPVGWTQKGDLETMAHAIAVVGDVVIVVGAEQVWPGTHDLKVWWLVDEDGSVLHEERFAAPFNDDQGNELDEVGRGVAIVGDEVVVVGERLISDKLLNQVYRRTVVLRYSLDGDLLGEWTSSGELTDEDAGMAVGSLRAGGFVVTGWGRNLGLSGRLLLSRWFTADGKTGPARIEPTTSDAVGFAIHEDREGKLVIAGTIKRPAKDLDGWVFAVPGPLGAHVWDVFRDGPSHGPDEAVGLAVDAWGYSYVVGSEFAGLQPRAFALRLYP